MRRGAEEILENVCWFIGQLDEDTLQTVQNLPVLEMAKAAFLFTQVPLPQRSKIYGALAGLFRKEQRETRGRALGVTRSDSG